MNKKYTVSIFIISFAILASFLLLLSAYLSPYQKTDAPSFLEYIKNPDSWGKAVQQAPRRP